jgi:transcriptional regulator with XRE-family HTH domain
MGKDSADPVMRRIRQVFEKSGKSLDQLGKEMGHDGETARKASWQFLNKVDDPRISTLRRFAKAMGIDVKELL